MALPKGVIDVPALRKALTVKQWAIDGTPLDPIVAVREDDDYLHVPRQFGLDFCQRWQIQFDNHTSLGDEVEFPEIPTPRDYQVPVITELEDACNSYYDFLFRARTGFGKTISTLLVAATLGRRTLVVVDSETLMIQWQEALQQHFGLPSSGVIQADALDVAHPVSIAMVQTLAQRRLPDWVYDHFGTIIFDESHIMGAPTYSEVLLDFSAAFRMGVSATVKRKDANQKLIEWNLGKVRVYVADSHAPSTVEVAFNDTVYSWYANSARTTGRYLSEISEDPARNLLISQHAIRLLESGRDTLVLSDRIEHLQGLMALCYYLGVDKEDMGLFTNQYARLEYEKDPTPKRRPPHWQPGTEYTPLRLAPVLRKTPKPKLKAVKETARLIFATYKMFEKGVDVPRLAGGIDATPRGAAEQVQGRILRVMEGKKNPIWVTIVDINSYRSLFQFSKRIPDYRINNSAIVLLRPDGEYESCQTSEVKRRAITRSEALRPARVVQTSRGLAIEGIQGMPGMFETAPARTTNAKRGFAPRLPPRPLPAAARSVTSPPMATRRSTPVSKPSPSTSLQRPSIRRR